METGPSTIDTAHRIIRAVLFDFGGVLADEGFREGLFAIARHQGLDSAEIHRIGLDTVYDSGYVLGKGSEADFWSLMRQRTGIRGDDAALSGEILSRFVLRPRMMSMVRRLRGEGIITAILSDQTGWLEWLDTRDRFFREFDAIFNSYRLGRGKRDPAVFDDAVQSIGVIPCEALFIDDMSGNVERAEARGLQVLLFEDEESCLAELSRLTGLNLNNEN